MSKYRMTRVVDAEQFYPQAKPWPQGIIENAESNTGYSFTAQGGPVEPGDWVIAREDGVMEHIKASVFVRDYQEIKR